jgi:hypothetical protein
MERPGLDGYIYLALVKLDAFLREMREHIRVPYIVDEETAVRRYLVYLSMLIDIALTDIAMSAIHSNDRAVQIKERMLVEYATKALYSNDNPGYALYFTTIHEADSVLKKLRRGGAGADEITKAEALLAAQRKRFPHVAHMAEVRLSEMMRHYTRAGDPLRNDEYVWLYGAPSALLHGDPEGMRDLMPVDDDGTQHFALLLEDARLNALMVDSGSNALVFCDAFVSRFHPENAGFHERLSDLARTFKELSLKHSHGRPDEGLMALRNELEEYHKRE